MRPVRILSINDLRFHLLDYAMTAFATPEEVAQGLPFGRASVGEATEIYEVLSGAGDGGFGKLYGYTAATGAASAVFRSAPSSTTGTIHVNGAKVADVGQVEFKDVPSRPMNREEFLREWSRSADPQPKVEQAGWYLVNVGQMWSASTICRTGTPFHGVGGDPPVRVEVLKGGTFLRTEPTPVKWVGSNPEIRSNTYRVVCEWASDVEADLVYLEPAAKAVKEQPEEHADAVAEAGWYLVGVTDGDKTSAVIVGDGTAFRTKGIPYCLVEVTRGGLYRSSAQIPVRWLSAGGLERDFRYRVHCEVAENISADLVYLESRSGRVAPKVAKAGWYAVPDVVAATGGFISCGAILHFDDDDQKTLRVAAGGTLRRGEGVLVEWGHETRADIQAIRDGARLAMKDPAHGVSAGFTLRYLTP